MTVFLSKESYEKFKSELIYLKTEGRKATGDALAEAREKGDLSENAEYDAAKEDHAKLEKKIAALEHALLDVRILEDHEIDTSTVTILTKVKVFNEKLNKDIEYQIVSEIESDFKERRLSVTSPIGKGLLGKKVGDIVEISTPAGMMKYKILEISK
ncbi:MAG: transcription elongation factor GreA [Chitinophagales bacterium]|jgi:transcription elongation factor GreA|nr:transcription elongation factor GreA [Chitinophagales bacterium]